MAFTDEQFAARLAPNTVPKGGPGLAGALLSPVTMAADAWSKTYTPQNIPAPQWEEWRQGKTVMGEGYGSDLHKRFKARAREAMTMPLIRLDQGGETVTLSIDQYLESAAADLGLKGEQNVRKLKAQVLRHLSGEPPQVQDTPKGRWLGEKIAEVAREAVDLASAGVSQGPVDTRPEVPFAPLTESQYNALVQKYGSNSARFMLSPQGVAAHDAMAAVNLLRTFQDGDRAPPWAQPGAALLAGAAEAVWPQSLYGDAMDTAKLNTMGGRGMMGRAYPGGRLAESMYWMDRWDSEKALAAQEGRPPMVKHPGTGATMPQYSSTTLDGVGRNMLSNENYWAYSSLPIRTMFQGLLEQSGEERGTLNEINAAMNRATPVIPDGSDPQKMRGVRDSELNHRMQTEGWLSAQWPRLMNSVGGKPEYLSPVADALGNLPRYWMEDLPTLAITAATGAGVIGSALRGGPSTLLTTVPRFAASMGREFVEEMPTELLAEGALNPKDFGENMFKARESNAWMGDTPANDPDYEKKYQQTYPDRAKARQDMSETWNRATKRTASVRFGEPQPGTSAGRALQGLTSGPQSQQEREYDEWREGQGQPVRRKSRPVAEVRW